MPQTSGKEDLAGWLCHRRAREGCLQVATVHLA